MHIPLPSGSTGTGLGFGFGRLPAPQDILVHDMLPALHEQELHASILPFHRCGTMIDGTCSPGPAVGWDTVQPRPMLHSSASGRMRIATGDDGVAWKASKMDCESRHHRGRV